LKITQKNVSKLNELTYEFSDASETDPADDTVKVPSLLFTKVPRNEGRRAALGLCKKNGRTSFTILEKTESLI
jgi:hypothetical protein